MFDINSAYNKNFNNPNSNNNNTNNSNEENPNRKVLNNHKNTHYKVLISNSFIYLENIKQKKFLMIDRDYYSMNVSDDYQILINEDIKNCKEIDCVLGMIEICNQQYFLIVYQSLKVAKLKNYEIFQIQKVDLIKLSKDKINDEKQSEIVRTNLQKSLSNGSFFYSIGFDLSSFTQKIFFEYNNNLNVNSFLEKVNENYLWNFKLLNGFAQYQIDKSFISFCICGFVGYKIINLYDNYPFEFIIIERINQKFIPDQNFLIDQNYSNYCLNFKQIEIIASFQREKIFSFIFYYSFFPFFPDNKFHKHYSNVIEFSKEFENYANILSIVSSEEKISNSLINMLKTNNSNLNKMQSIETRNYNINLIENNNSFIKFTDFFSYYLDSNAKSILNEQSNIYWLISLNNKISSDDNCFNFIERLTWIFLRKTFKLLQIKDIGNFSNPENNNPILKYYQDIWLYYRKFQIHQSNKNNELKDQISLKSIVDYINFDRHSYKKEVKQFNKLNLLVLTFNLAGASIKNSNGEIINYDITELFTNNILYKNNIAPDIIAIGLQEIIKLEVGNILLMQNSKNVEYWQNKFINTIKRIYPNEDYILIKELDLVGILMLVLIKSKYNKNVRIINNIIIKNGMMGSLGNKGNVILILKIFESIVIFCSGHYTSGHSKNKERLKILDQVLNTEIKYNNIISSFKDFDIWFIFGDLNFRINYDYENTIQLCQNKNIELLLNADQFNLSKIDNRKLDIIDEGLINFLPTYKYNKNNNNFAFEPNKMRVPSYCDRIFYKNNFKENHPSIILKQYDSISNVQFSDHRCVFGVFEIYCKVFYKNEKEKIMNDLMNIDNNIKIKNFNSENNINNLNIENYPINIFPKNYNSEDIKVYYPSNVSKNNQNDNNNNNYMNVNNYSQNNINFNENIINSNNINLENNNRTEKTMQNLDNFFNVKNEGYCSFDYNNNQYMYNDMNQNININNNNFLNQNMNSNQNQNNYNNNNNINNNNNNNNNNYNDINPYPTNSNNDLIQF